MYQFIITLWLLLYYNYYLLHFITFKGKSPTHLILPLLVCRDFHRLFVSLRLRSVSSSEEGGDGQSLPPGRLSKNGFLHSAPPSCHRCAQRSVTPQERISVCHSDKNLILLLSRSVPESSPLLNASLPVFLLLPSRSHPLSASPGPGPPQRSGVFSL